ncbi:MAG: MipA/OmpV family protein [Simplicispira sp.]|nr:MipA/OmpV family protein [Simplicispira sp.]
MNAAHPFKNRTRPWKAASAGWFVCLALAFPAQAQQAAQSAPRLLADEEVPVALPASGPAERPFNYVLGMLYGSSPAYAGADGHKSHLRPVLSLAFGRFRISSSRGNSIMNHGLDDRGSGASALLVERERFRLSTSVRIDGGRSSSDDPLLLGLPEVRSTLRGRVSMGYALSEHWSLGAGLSQDLLGRSGGAQLNTSLRYTFDLTPHTTVGVGVGAAFADGTYMRSHFGVPATAAGTSPLPTFVPGAGLYNVDAGLDVMTALNRRWVIFGNAGVSQMRGDARRSPLTQRATAYSVSVGLAYRCCR